MQAAIREQTIHPHHHRHAFKDLTRRIPASGQRTKSAKRKTSRKTRRATKVTYTDQKEAKSARTAVQQTAMAVRTTPQRGGNLSKTSCRIARRKQRRMKHWARSRTTAVTGTTGIQWTQARRQMEIAQGGSPRNRSISPKLSSQDSRTPSARAAD